MARIAYLRLTSALAFVTFPAVGAPEMSWAGAPLGPGDIVFHGQGEQMHQRTTGACRWGIISLSISDLVAHGRAIARRNLAPPPVGRIIRAPPGHVRWLRGLHCRACRLAETKPDMIAHREVARALDQELIHALVTCLSTGEVITRPPDQQQRTQIMIRLEEFLASGTALSLPIPALSKPWVSRSAGSEVACADFLENQPARFFGCAACTGYARRCFTPIPRHPTSPTSHELTGFPRLAALRRPIAVSSANGPRIPCGKKLPDAAESICRNCIADRKYKA